MKNLALIRREPFLLANISPFVLIGSAALAPSSPIYAASGSVAASPVAMSSEIEGGSGHPKISSNTKLLIALVAASTALGAILLFILCMYYGKHKKKSKGQNEIRSVLGTRQVCGRDLSLSL